VLGELGRGGMGVVYKARQLKADRVVALKMILTGGHTGAEGLKRFTTEAESLARLQHTHIVQVYEVGEHDGLPFFSLEFCPGGSLEQKLNKAPLAPTEAAALVEKLARAMAVAHDRGVIHRDLKPANVLLAEDGTPKITDFGLAKKLDEAGQTQSGSIIGTPSYMAPEQAEGKNKELCPACDLYALGAILYACLTGRPPFKAATMTDTLLQVIHDEPVPPTRLQPKCPRDLETICLKCLQKDRPRRYATALALAEDCAAFLDGRTISARAVSRVERVAKWVRRRPTAAALIGVSLAALVALLVGGLWHHVRVEQEKKEAVGNLYHSLVGQARGLRLARTDGYHDRCWTLLQQALSLETPDCDLGELRREATACLGDPVGRHPLTWPDLPRDIKVAVVHPDGEWLAIGLGDGSVSLHRREPSEVLRLLQGQPMTEASSLAFGQAGRRLVCAHKGKYNQGIFRVFQQDGGKWACVREFETERHFGVVGGPANAEWLAGWSADGITLWDLETGASLRPFRLAEREYVRAVALSPDGRLLAAACANRDKDDPSVQLWELPGGKARPRLRPNLAGVGRMAFSPDSKLLACGCGAGLALYETDTQTPFRQLLAGGDVIQAVAFSPNGQWIALHQPQTRLVRLWSLPLRREVATFSHPAAIGLSVRMSELQQGTVSFTATGNLVLASDQAIHLRDLSGGPEKLLVTQNSFGIPDLAFRPKGGTTLAAACKDRLVTLWDPVRGTLSKSFPEMEGQAQNVACSPDGYLLAASDWASKLRVWEVDSGKELLLPGEPPGPLIWSLAFSPDGQLLGAAGNGGLRLWRVKRGAGAGAPPILEFLPLPFRLTSWWTFLQTSRCLCFSPNSRRVAWNDGGQVRLWDVVQERFVEHKLPEIRVGPRSIAFLPNGRLVLALKGRVEVWDPEQEQPSLTLGGEEFTQWTGITLEFVFPSSDGKRLAVAGNRITIWDLQSDSHEPLLALPPEPFSIWGVAWSPEGKLLATGSSSGALVIWPLETIRAQLATIGLDWKD
jgi:WD40 repeat protein/tRNA A-37 threonylcarbamoyl transferase component Bud32